MIWLLAFLALHPLLLALFCAWAWTGWRAIAALGLVVDVLLNFSTVALALGWPQSGEWTISKRLKRQRFDVGRRGYWAWWLSELINQIKPGHI